MTDYKATPEQWADTESWAAEKLSCYSCVLELRARVEALEVKYETQRLATLEWGADVDTVKRWSDQHLQRIMALEAAQQQPEPIDEEENDRRFHVCMDLIRNATPEQIRSAAGLPERKTSKVYEISEPLQLTPEQAQQVMDLLAPEPRRNYPAKPDSSLVQRVALAISGIEYGLERDEEAVNWASEARAAIREVAAWLREQQDGDLLAAAMLEREAER
jgi:hypothetical protein